jgi:hypothetical protein
MPKISQTTLTCLMALLPLVGNAQTCNTTSVAATTPTSRFTSNANGTVLDKYTGLIWKTCSEGQQWLASTRACNKVAETYNWQQALNNVQMLNSKGGFAKYKDWRVPNIKELSTLVETQCYYPAINLRVFPGVDAGAVVMSSSSVVSAGSAVWFVDFSGYGEVGNSPKDLSSKQVRLVRGGQ